MMENTKLTEVLISGRLFIPGTELVYDVLSSHPVRDIDNWQAQGNIYRFYVAAGDGSKARVITVNGPFVFDPFTNGRPIKVQLETHVEEEEEGEDKIIADEIKDLFESARIAVTN